ncbi:MAG: AarF/ABC1/UbiB kinase family protein [Hyphomicrobiales bacterium]|nr:AarF/ABC1/UbiB kinase family protein [Hyphomicrobiales bacterium]
MTDREANRFSARAARYARVGANVGGVAARFAAQQLTGGRTGARDASNAAVLAQALGGLKGPLMKVAQLMATVPDLLPPEYADELAKLQSDAPPMGAAFVKRRMQAELGPGWEKRFKSFDLKPAAAASLGQVHKAVSHEGEPLACKLQYPDMKSAVEADLKQLDVLFAVHRRFNPVIDTREAAKEIGARVREELDYFREAKNAALYRHMLADEPMVRTPRVHSDLSTERLLTMQWLEGEKILAFKSSPQDVRDRIGVSMFKAWWLPFSRFGVIHGDPHLGNYSVFGKGEGINLLDYGCIRIFPPKFVGGVVDLYRGLQEGDQKRIVHAYETWGFKGLKKDVIETLNIWARFIYGPLLEDRVRTIADGIEPGRYGRREAFQVHQALKEKGPITVPREFVFMDRAAVGLGAVFLHLGAELNYHRMFEEALGDFRLEQLAANQQAALAKAGLA